MSASPNQCRSYQILPRFTGRDRDGREKGLGNVIQQIFELNSCTLQTILIVKPILLFYPCYHSFSHDHAELSSASPRSRSPSIPIFGVGIQMFGRGGCQRRLVWGECRCAILLVFESYKARPESVKMCTKVETDALLRTLLRRTILDEQADQCRSHLHRGVNDALCGISAHSWSRYYCKLVHLTETRIVSLHLERGGTRNADR